MIKNNSDDKTPHGPFFNLDNKQSSCFVCQQELAQNQNEGKYFVFDRVEAVFSFSSFKET